MMSKEKQEFENDKNSKNKHQNFKHSQKGNMDFDERGNMKIINMQNEQNSFFRFFDINDFPALKNPEKFSSKIKPDNKKVVTAISYTLKKTPSETSLAVSNSKSAKNDAVDWVTKEKPLIQSIPENNIEINPDKRKVKKITFSKKVSVQNQKNPNKKKRSDPILINFHDIFTINKIQRKTKQHNIVRNNAKRFRDKEFLSGNPLDSSSPKRLRGKHREIKKKKLSNLKLTIIKERIIKQKMREKVNEDPEFENKCINLADTIDFKKEIDMYLNELEKKKLKNAENNSKKLKEIKNEKKKLDQENFKTKSVEKTEEDAKKIITDIKEKENLSAASAVVEVKFSSKFREYCNNIITPDLNATVTVFITELIKLQDRLFLKDPIKAKTKKRHVSGIREVKKYLNLKKVKMIIIPPNLEKLQMKGSVYDSINQLKSMAESQNVPYGFALNRYKLGKCTKKNVPISAFAVLNYEGIETLHDNVLRELLEAKRKFSELEETKKEREKEKLNDINSQVISSLISVFQKDLKV